MNASEIDPINNALEVINGVIKFVSSEITPKVRIKDLNRIFTVAINDFCGSANFPNNNEDKLATI